MQFLLCQKCDDNRKPVGCILEIGVYGDILKAVQILESLCSSLRLFKHTVLVTDMSNDFRRSNSYSDSSTGSYFKNLRDPCLSGELYSGIWSVQGDVLLGGEDIDPVEPISPIV